VGAHTYGYNTVGLGICIIGDFTNRIPDVAALDAVRTLIQCGVDSGYVTADYVMMGHRDTNNGTECPGNTFYPYLQTWPHYDNSPAALSH
jgi:N-acetylmuramoyl-L-alanine amidase